MPGSLFAIVLGIMQDAGLPHIGCACARCRSGRVERVASLGIVDARLEPARVWLVDATPDITWQWQMLAPWLGPHPQRPERWRQPAGIFLTHAHMGHTAGLAQLGPEGGAVQGLPLYASLPLLAALQATVLWRPLLPRLALQPLTAGQTLPLAPDLALTPLAVPHRDELNAGTLAFHLQGPQRSLLYVPDIDSWAQWPEARHWLWGVDDALVDATFYRADELGKGRPVAHPPVVETLAFCAGMPGHLWLTHLNHTNPVLDAGSLPHQAVLAAGAGVARTGQRFPL